MSDNTKDTNLNVYNAWLNFCKDLSKVGIPKSRNNERQNYKYRGISDVSSIVSPLLAEHKLIVLLVDSQLLKSETVNRGSNSTPWNLATCKFNWRVVLVSTGEYFDVSNIASGFDDGDKAFGKATSYAMKLLIFANTFVPEDGVAIDNEDDGHPIAIHESGKNEKKQKPIYKNVTSIKLAFDVAKDKNYADLDLKYAVSEFNAIASKKGVAAVDENITAKDMHDYLSKVMSEHSKKNGQ